MPSEAASAPQSSYDEARLDAGWKDEFWLALVGSVDAWLRSYYGILEFTDDPSCMLRLAASSARFPASLSDGTEIAAGEPIGALHLWNERLPRYAGNGPDLGWAAEMRRRLAHSLRLLAAHVEGDPAWQGIRAFNADTVLSSRLGETQLRRLALRYGLERVQPRPSLSRQLHAIGVSINAWFLARAFNPAAAPRQRFLRERYELWISRSTLLKLYAPRGEAADRVRRRTG
jgi:hypothetical protein